MHPHIISSLLLIATLHAFSHTGQKEIIITTQQQTTQDSIFLASLIEEENKGTTDNLYNLLRDGKSLSPFRKPLPMPIDYSLDASNLTLPIIGKILSPYGYRNKRLHSGTDIKLIDGDSVATAGAGVVIFARYYGGYGNLIVVRHDPTFETFYSHLSSILVTEGQLVRKGETIGLGGRTGRATGSHLHFEVRIAGKAIDSELIFDFTNKRIRATQFTFNPHGKGNLVPSKNSSYTPSLQQHAPNPHTTTSATRAPSSKGISPSPSSTQPVTTSATPPKEPTEQRHRVKKGDTLYSIAQRYSTSVDQIKRRNSLPSNTIHPDKILIIPSQNTKR